LGRNGARGARRILDIDQVPKGASPGPASRKEECSFLKKRIKKIDLSLSALKQK
jgi:hypothetical protein